MKKVILILTVAAVTLFTSCEEDYWDNSDPVTTGNYGGGQTGECQEDDPEFKKALKYQDLMQTDQMNAQSYSYLATYWAYKCDCNHTYGSAEDAKKRVDAINYLVDVYYGGFQLSGHSISRVSSCVSK